MHLLSELIRVIKQHRTACTLPSISDPGVGSPTGDPPHKSSSSGDAVQPVPLSNLLKLTFHFTCFWHIRSVEEMFICCSKYPIFHICHKDVIKVTVFTFGGFNYMNSNCRSDFYFIFLSRHPSQVDILFVDSCIAFNKTQWKLAGDGLFYECKSILRKCCWPRAIVSNMRGKKNKTNVTDLVSTKATS